MAATRAAKIGVWMPPCPCTAGWGGPLLPLLRFCWHARRSSHPQAYHEAVWL